MLLITLLVVPICFMIGQKIINKWLLTYKRFKFYLLSLSVAWVAILIYMILFIVPRFGDILEELNLQLPILTQWILTLNTLRLPTIIFAIVLVGLVAAVLQNQNIKNIIETNFSRNVRIISAIFIILLGFGIGIIVFGLFLPLWQIR